ncbi:MAG: AAA family ATPase, partial [Firmicutes bacterium]|nr:AAA family ATPase [Bacillota bacterium]
MCRGDYAERYPGTVAKGAPVTVKGVVCICGKGGVGKTTISALLSRLVLERQGIRGLAVDADPGGGLSMALSLPVKKTVNDLRK